MYFLKSLMEEFNVSNSKVQKWSNNGLIDSFQLSGVLKQMWEQNGRGFH